MAFPLGDATPGPLGLDPAPLARLCALVERDIAEGHHPGAELGVARHGRLALWRSFGQTRLVPPRAAEDRTLWPLCATTELLTAAALWCLAEEGALRFADTVAGHLPGFAAHGKEGITLIQLLTHQAGFPSATVPPEAWEDADLLRRTVCDLTLEWEPGSRTRHHPAVAHWVAAALIHAVSGEDHRSIIRERVIVPLGLGDELFAGLPPEEGDRAAILHDPAAEPGAPRGPENTPAWRAASVPGGGGYGTARHGRLLPDAGGRLTGRRLFPPRLLAYVTRDVTGDRVDDDTGLPMHRGLGPHLRGTTPAAVPGGDGAAVAADAGAG